MFKRSLIGVAATAAALTVLVPVGTASAAPDRDTVIGEGSSAIANFKFTAFNQGTTPDTPSGGHWHVDNPLLSFDGSITCLHVEGNRAAFIYPVESGSKPEAAVGQAVLVFFEDNGATGDKMGFFGPGPVDKLGGCFLGPTPLDLTSGGVTIHDAQ